MKCPKCTIKMKCTFSVPIAKLSRYRSYKCECGNFEETYETVMRLLPPLPEECRVMRELIEEAKSQRFGFVKKKAPTAT